MLGNALHGQCRSKPPDPPHRDSVDDAQSEECTEIWGGCRGQLDRGEGDNIDDQHRFAAELFRQGPKYECPDGSHDKCEGDSQCGGDDRDTKFFGHVCKTKNQNEEVKRIQSPTAAVSYTHLRAHETDSYLVCRLLLEK